MSKSGTLLPGGLSDVGQEMELRWDEDSAMELAQACGLNASFDINSESCCFVSSMRNQYKECY